MKRSIAANAECYGNTEKGAIHFVRANEETVRDEAILSLHLLPVKIFKHVEELKDDYNHHLDLTMVCHIILASQGTAVTEPFDSK